MFFSSTLLQLDSATSLIQAAKNLMNAVVLTVKASYVASTKYQKVYGTAAVNSPVVSWRMKAPEKKPLVKREKPEECQTRVRRGSQKKHISPVQALSEFKAMDSFWAMSCKSHVLHPNPPPQKKDPTSGEKIKRKFLLQCCKERLSLRTRFAHCVFSDASGRL